MESHYRTFNIMIISSNMTDFVCMLTPGVESLPDDMQRNISQMRELDLHYQGTCTV